jgi:DNA repair photolyase
MIVIEEGYALWGSCRRFSCLMNRRPTGKFQRKWQMSISLPVCELPPHSIIELKSAIRRNPEFEEKSLAQFSANCGVKCDQGCAYCSTGTVNRRIIPKLAPGVDPYDLETAVIDPDFPELLAKQAASKRVRGMIQLCTTVDAWSPVAQHYNMGRRCLDAILKEEHWTVRILTKNAAVRDDFDLIARPENRERVLVGVSLTAHPSNKYGCRVIRCIEPQASSISERWQTMRQAHKMGLRTYAMLCPLLPGISNQREQIGEMVKGAEGFGAEEIFAEAVNHRGRSLVATQEVLHQAGYKEHADSIAHIRTLANWSEYVTQLIQDVQASVRQYSDISKLRFLLYREGLEDRDVEMIQRDPEGIRFVGSGWD